ncbi:type II toxin-antitoxin system VapC family toxin [Alkalimarinus coralli]|uniref:type II toxin-antitoxin system VapC family toxin n=1 Tax=Alkalimarinus coralli TaxID=2935863 RepID=UPI00202B5BF3|nr:type II toxin-antitoxin system VapC family toxin [Alkalimarinus coralli]
MYLLDTNVVSELRKVKSGKADKNVENWSFQVDPQLLYVSSIVIHELELGILLAERSDPTKGQVLRKWMNDFVLPAFEGRILPVDKDVALVSAKYHVPDPKPYRDTLIAATTIVHDMAIVTRNVDDFNLDGLKVLNPWESN